MTRYKHIDTSFKPDEEELYQFVIKLARGNQSFLIKKAIEYYRCGQSIFPIGNLDELKEAAQALKEMRREYGSDWQDKLIQQRKDDNYFDEEYS
jgi:hypothetical protein